MSHSAKEVLQELSGQQVQKVKVGVTDVDGILRGKYVHWDKFRSSMDDGFGFCSVIFGWDSSDVCYDNASYTGWHTGYPDTLARLDPNTLRYVPWDNGVPFLLADFYEPGGSKPLAVCPRQVLKRVESRARDLGYTAKIGCEFEWFNFDETPHTLQNRNFVDPRPLTPGMFGYSILRSSLQSDFFNDIMDQMEAFRVPLEGLHTETGPGVYEAALKVESAIEAADRAVLFKTGVKEIAMRYQTIASFMARWSETLPGCSGHIHQSLQDERGTNLFYDKDDPMQLSDLAKSYLAGQIKYTPQLLVMLAPTVNSYKRLVKGYWAPISPSWGVDNRTCAFRVIPFGSKSSRIETRVGGADLNPYLGVAASLGAGLLGIEENLTLTQAPVQGNGYDEANLSGERFSTNLYEASERFRRSEVACRLFGEDFVQHFSQSRLWEWEQSQKAVTDWELKRYFEII